MNWLDIFCFTSVARTQSFSITAQELMISQQAVSRHIKALEDELGFPLFLRNFQSIRLSRAGERMLDYFARRDRLLADYRRSLSLRRENGILRIAWTQWLGCPDWFAAAVHRFQTDHPEITVLTHDLTMGELNAALEDDRIDVLLTTRYACGFLPISWTTLSLQEVPFYLIGSARTEYDAERLSLYTHIADFAGEPDEASVRARVWATYEKMGLQPRRVESYPEMGSVCMNVMLKSGVTFGTPKTSMAMTSNFMLFPTGLTASAVLCLTPHAGQRPADIFAEYARSEAMR